METETEENKWEQFVKGIALFITAIFVEVYIVAPVILVIYYMTMYQITNVKLDIMFVLGVLLFRSIWMFKPVKQKFKASVVFKNIISRVIFVGMCFGLAWIYNILVTFN
jgi:hypothetical protein